MQGHTEGCAAACVQVGASNELPESEELDALYDRFLIRRRVSQVTALHMQWPQSIVRQATHGKRSLPEAPVKVSCGAQVSLAGLPSLLSSTRSQSLMATGGVDAAPNGSGAPSAAGSITISEQEMANIRCAHHKQRPCTRPHASVPFTDGPEVFTPASCAGAEQQSAWLPPRSEAAQRVAVPEEIINLLSDVRSFLQDKCEPPVYVSDRRLLKTVALMQAWSGHGREPAPVVVMALGGVWHQCLAELFIKCRLRPTQAGAQQ